MLIICFSVMGLTNKDFSAHKATMACCNALFRAIKRLMTTKIWSCRWLKSKKNMLVPDNLIPHCLVCGEKMEVNLRKDEPFVQDKG